MSRHGNGGRGVCLPWAAWIGGRRLALAIAALTLLIAACAEAPSPEAPAMTRTPDAEIRRLVNAGLYAEALQALDAIEAEPGDDDADMDRAYERLVLRAWAEAGLGDCRLAAELAQTPRPGMTDEQLARLIARAADLAVTGLDAAARHWWSDPFPTDTSTLDWDERVEAATCVLDAAALRFPEDAHRIEERRDAMAENLKWARSSPWPIRCY
jgi:hypothetical protein